MRRGPIEVLLSTHNGARYLPALLESVRLQTCRRVLVSARDDGSTDASALLLERAKRGGNLHKLVLGENVGAAKSFLWLLQSVEPTSEYAAFCDQDDVWLPDKLERAVEALASCDGAAMYCAAVRLVDEGLSAVGIHRRCLNPPSFGNALVENIATGCTIVLNRCAIDLLNSVPQPDYVLMHDAWCYLVVAGFGQVIFDPQPRVLYRLHDQNAVGVKLSPLSAWIGRAHRHLRRKDERPLTQQALQFCSLYDSILRDPQRTQLRSFLDAQESYRSRLVFAASRLAYRQRRIDDTVYRVLYVLHRI